MQTTLAQKKFQISFAAIAISGIIIIASVWWIFYNYYTGYTYEDAMITFRYARNLALGRGFVFNEGERVLGTTTPLFTIMIALLGRIIGANYIPLIAKTFTITFGVGAGLLNYSILRSLGFSNSTSIFAMIMFFANNNMLFAAIGGMETTLVLFLMALSLHALSLNNYRISFISCSLLILTRIDGAIWYILIAIAIITNTGKIPYKHLIISAFILIPWFVFSIIYFGSPIPNSIIAKQTISGSTPLHLSLGTLKAFIVAFTNTISFSPKSFVSWMNLFFVIAGAYSALSSKYRNILWVLVVFPALYGAILYLGNAPIGFPWYFTPMLWSLLLLVAIGVDKISLVITKSLPEFRWRTGLHQIFIAIVGSILVIPTLNMILTNMDIVRRFQVNEDTTRRGIGEWLQNNSSKDSSVGMEAIGYQGYYSDRSVIDFAGIASPSVIKLHKESKSNAEVFYKILTELKPDFLVLRSFEVDENEHFHGGRLFENEEQRNYFMEHYREVQRFHAPYTELWGKFSHLTIYKRM